MKFAPIVLCIVGTQIREVHAENLVGSLGYDNAYVVDTTTRSGGLAMFWATQNTIQMCKFLNLEAAPGGCHVSMTKHKLSCITEHGTQ